VKDRAVHDAVLARVTESASACGLTRVGMTPSPITGAAGNQEFLLHLRAAAPGAAAGTSER
jgi:predicted rRNA methylase YqxC with S4 and FtsJ domains